MKSFNFNMNFRIIVRRKYYNTDITRIYQENLSVECFFNKYN